MEQGVNHTRLTRVTEIAESLSYLYVEQAVLNQKHGTIEYINKGGRTLIPVVALAVLLPAPGTSITHAAVKALAENGCKIVWTGEQAIRFYAQGTG